MLGNIHDRIFMKHLLIRPEHEVAVVIPVYKTDLSEYETISLDRSLKIFCGQKIIILSPRGLPLERIKLLNAINYEVQCFQESSFTSIESYSRLLLSSDFYIRFIKYKFILIYQLDAFVFSDQLIDWCRQSYDYIGAPWFGVDWFSEHHKPGLGNFWGHLGIQKCMVGNGGFSLRRIRSFLFALLVLKERAENWTHNEDLFWSFEVPNNLPFFTRPSVEEALKFSFELNPKECFAANNRLLPFGCHAWEKYDIDFWRPKFAAYGYQI